MKSTLIAAALITFVILGCATSPSHTTHSEIPHPYAKYSMTNTEQRYLSFPSGLVLPQEAVEKGLVDATDWGSLLNFQIGGGTIYIQTKSGVLPIMGDVGDSFIVGGLPEGSNLVPKPKLK